MLVVGSGGREHALAWKLAQSAGTAVLSAPGNPGMEALGPCYPVAVGDLVGLTRLAREQRPDLVVVGPEAPLADGLADRLRADGLAVFGPSQAAAEIEWSKVFAKRFMQRHGIPTAPFAVFDDAGAALAHVAQRSLPLVVKADGLAAGKGVRVCATRAEARAAVEDMLARGVFGDAGRRVVVEDCLQGIEASVHCLSDGASLALLPTAMDYKRAQDGDRGPNTGGMGTFAPAVGLDAAALEGIRRRVLEPAIEGLRQEGREFRGALYVGLMLTAQGPMVLEFNCRFGDPEAQVMLPLVEGDLLPALQACAGAVAERPSGLLSLGRGHCACVVIASHGYPGDYATGLPITFDGGLPEGCLLFHAGTARRDGRLVTSGGRVLGVATLPQPSLAAAITLAYQGAARVRFEGAFYRRDIGQGRVPPAT